MLLIFINSDTLNITLKIPIDKVLDDANRTMLEAEFTMEEVKFSVFNMEKNKAPGPDGFPIEFYQKFWHLIKADLMHLFKLFHREVGY